MKSSLLYVNVTYELISARTRLRECIKELNILDFVRLATD